MLPEELEFLPTPYAASFGPPPSESRKRPADENNAPELNKRSKSNTNGESSGIIADEAIILQAGHAQPKTLPNPEPQHNTNEGIGLNIKVEEGNNNANTTNLTQFKDNSGNSPHALNSTPGDQTSFTTSTSNQDYKPQRQYITPTTLDSPASRESSLPLSSTAPIDNNGFQTPSTLPGDTQNTSTVKAEVSNTANTIDSDPNINVLLANTNLYLTDESQKAVTEAHVAVKHLAGILLTKDNDMWARTTSTVLNGLREIQKKWLELESVKRSVSKPATDGRVFGSRGRARGRCKGRGRGRGRGRGQWKSLQ